MLNSEGVGLLKGFSSPFRPKMLTGSTQFQKSSCFRVPTEELPRPSDVLVKGFLRWYCKSRTGRLDKKPNIKSVRNTTKKFYSGFQRVTGTEISEALRKEGSFVSVA